eukprot:2413189-Pleurochrysis_carterae.AAC.2
MEKYRAKRSRGAVFEVTQFSRWPQERTEKRPRNTRKREVAKDTHTIHAAEQAGEEVERQGRHRQASRSKDRQ